MDSVRPVHELEQKLKEAGEHLASPPSSVSDLLNLLDKTKQLLARVGQAPSISMQKALVPSMGALIADELIKHAETDVKISVASCLCEVVRITAPDQTYEDEVMKEIFKLYVLAFEQLSNITGQSYHKVIHILQSVAKVKSFLLMLDLECDALVFEMFEQFLSKIRIDHPRTVFSEIETIMTMIIEESDEISIELLSLLISRAKKENQIVSPASWKLAEKVLKSCSNTLLKELINSNLDDYVEAITLICQNGHENEHVGIRSTSRTNSTHKRDFITLENYRSTKKQKYNDNSQFKGKDLKTPKRGRPKKSNNPNLGQNSHKETTSTRVRDRRQSSKTKGNIKNSGSDNGSGDEDDIPKKWREDLVGHTIKVWWPLDKMYYEGVVASYDPLSSKHKVLYADGDEELLDLNNEKWKMVDEVSVDQKAKKNRDASLTKEDNSTSPKRSNSPQPADSSKTEDVICNADNEKDNPAPTPAIFHGLKITEKTANNVEKNESKRINSPPPADSSKTEDIISNVDDQKDNPAPTPAISDRLTVTEKTIDNNVEKNGELDPSGELQETSLLESSEATQGLENTENLACES